MSVRRVPTLKVDYLGTTIKWPTGHPIFEGSVIECEGARYKVEGPLIDEDGTTTGRVGLLPVSRARAPYPGEDA